MADRRRSRSYGLSLSMAGRRARVMPVRWRSILQLHSISRLKPVSQPRHYKLERTSRALNPTGGFLKGFAYSLNPYIGCAFGSAADVRSATCARFPSR